MKDASTTNKGANVVFMGVILCVLVAILIMTYGACFINSGENTAIEDRFVIVKEDEGALADLTYYIVADKETGVMYLSVDGLHRFGITPLLNADGTPQLYDFGEEEDADTQPMLDNVTPLSDPASINERGVS